MLCGPQPNAWPSVRKRSNTKSCIFCGEILLEALHVLGGVLLSNRRWLMSFTVPCDILVDCHYLLKQGIVLLRSCAIRASLLWIPWIAQVTWKGTSCLSSACWIVPLFFLKLAFVEALIIEWGVGKRTEYFKLIDQSIHFFLYFNHSWQTNAAWCGFCFVLKLKLFSAKSIQIQPDVFKPKHAKYSFSFFLLVFFFFFSCLSPTPLPLTICQIFCSDLRDSEFQYVLLHKGYVAAVPGNTCIKNGENWFQNFVHNGWLLEGNLKTIFCLSVAVICLSCHGL